MLRKLISGGQTGVDRAALDVGLALGLTVGGGCPKGRRAEDGPIPDRYPLMETPERSDPARTRRNSETAGPALRSFPEPESGQSGLHPANLDYVHHHAAGRRRSPLSWIRYKNQSDQLLARSLFSDAASTRVVSPPHDNLQRNDDDADECRRLFSRSCPTELRLLAQGNPLATPQTVAGSRTASAHRRTPAPLATGTPLAASQSGRSMDGTGSGLGRGVIPWAGTPAPTRFYSARRACCSSIWRNTPARR